MRVLTNLEMREFEKTYHFLQNYIGVASIYVKSPYRIKFDGKILNRELLDFISLFDRVKSMPELGFKSLHNLTALEKITLIFNGVSQSKKNIAIQKLINYCFKNQIQPYKLRVDGFNDVEFEINYKEPEVITTTFIQESIANDDIEQEKLKAS